jgi:hypothetical protein
MLTGPHEGAGFGSLELATVRGEKKSYRSRISPLTIAFTLVALKERNPNG